MTVYEARKTMKYGPGRRPVVVHAGDEIPGPVKRNLIEFGWVAEVNHYSGRSWADACKDRDLAEDIEIANMPEGPAKEHAKKWRARELDPSLAAQQTIHPTQYAKPGDYFNVADPQAETAARGPVAPVAQVAGPPQAPEVLPAALMPAAPAMPDTSDVPDVFAADDDDTEDTGDLEVDGDKPDARPARKPRGRPRKR